eukprot:gene6551-8998_t
MACALSFHFFGYECARAASISLLAAKENGLGNEAVPLTIALGSPSSGLVLYLYTKSIKNYGSKVTLRISNIACALLLFIIFSNCGSLSGYTGKFLVISFYVFREIYVSLLSTQHWAFIASTLDKSTSNYLVTFTGVVSIANAVGGCAVEQIVKLGGVRYLLLTAFLATILSFTLTEISYLFVPLQQMQNHQDNLKHNNKVEKNDPVEKTNIVHNLASNPNGAIKSDTNHATNSDVKSTTKVASSTKPVRKGFWFDSWALVQKHDILRLLFAEAITHQLCTNMLNLMFHNGLRKEILDDSIRAVLVGRFFATVNIASCTLQLVILPHILSQSSLPVVLKYIPFIVFMAVIVGVTQPGLYSIMLGFGTMKVLEYAIMSPASEMIYMPMGHDVRYLGKELIKFFGHKLGKSAASLVLSGFISQLNPSLASQSLWGVTFTFIWGITMYELAGYLKERDLLDNQHDNNNNNNQKSEFDATLSPKKNIQSRFDQIRNNAVVHNRFKRENHDYNDEMSLTSRVGQNGYNRYGYESHVVKNKVYIKYPGGIVRMNSTDSTSVESDSPNNVKTTHNNQYKNIERKHSLKYDNKNNNSHNNELTKDSSCESFQTCSTDIHYHKINDINSTANNYNNEYNEYNNNDNEYNNNDNEYNNNDNIPYVDSQGDLIMGQVLVDQADWEDKERESLTSSIGYCYSQDGLDLMDNTQSNNNNNNNNDGYYEQKDMNSNNSNNNSNTSLSSNYYIAPEMNRSRENLLDELKDILAYRSTQMNYENHHNNHNSHNNRNQSPSSAKSRSFTPKRPIMLRVGSTQVSLNSLQSSIRHDTN